MLYLVEFGEYSGYFNEDDSQFCIFSTEEKAKAFAEKHAGVVRLGWISNGDVCMMSESSL